MPTRFWVKNKGKPSSNNIEKPTTKKIGEKIKNRKTAKNLLSIFKWIKSFI